jgi:transcriptional regulator with XRE-family HTH domain
VFNEEVRQMLASWLVDALRARGWTQTQLAVESQKSPDTRLSRDTINGIARGRREVREESLRRAATVLGVPLPSLIGRRPQGRPGEALRLYGELVRDLGADIQAGRLVDPDAILGRVRAVWHAIEVATLAGGGPAQAEAQELAEGVQRLEGSAESGIADRRRPGSG